MWVAVWSLSKLLLNQFICFPICPCFIWPVSNDIAIGICSLHVYASVTKTVTICDRYEYSSILWCNITSFFLIFGIYLGVYFSQCLCLRLFPFTLLLSITSKLSFLYLFMFTAEIRDQVLSRAQPIRQGQAFFQLSLIPKLVYTTHQTPPKVWFCIPSLFRFIFKRLVKCILTNMTYITEK